MTEPSGRGRAFSCGTWVERAALMGVAILLGMSSVAGRAAPVKYTYDAAGRLLAADYGSNTVSTFTYDLNGNLLQRATTMPASADVRLTKVASVTAASAGLPFTYTLAVTNAGPDPASDVVVIDTLPFGILLNSLGSPSQGAASLSNRTIIAELGVLVANQSATLTVSVFHGTTNFATNIAMVTAATADPNTNNNTAMDDSRGLVSPDTDNDGMPNWWETLHGISPFSSTGNNGADGDSDNDGIRNFDEWVADTDPQNPDSYFHIGTIEVGSGEVALGFESSAIRLYDGLFASELTESATNFTSFEGTGGVMEITHTNGDGGFYQLRAEVP